jgi:hypothetical protein
MPFPKGGRIYVLQHGRRGRDNRVTIGRHGSDVTVEPTRLEAYRSGGIIATGEIPPSPVRVIDLSLTSQTSARDT